VCAEVVLADALTLWQGWTWLDPVQLCAKRRQGDAD
jgi:hypothetical protein